MQSIAINPRPRTRNAVWPNSVMSTVDFPKFSYDFRDALLNVTILESLTHGIYTTFVGLTLWMLMTREARNGNTWTRAFFVILVTAMHLLATAHLALRWNFVRQGFIVNGDTASTIFDYLFLGPEWMLASSVVFCANTLIADCVLIWRCWIIWGRRWGVVVVPGLCTVVGTVFSAFTIYQQASAPPPGSAWSQSQIDWGIPYFSMSLTVTVLCTCLIIYRVLTVRAATNRFDIASHFRVVAYDAVIEIIVESAALYSISLIIFLVYYVRALPQGNYPLVILTTATGLAPTLIVFRVCSGQTRPEESWKEPPSTFIYFTQSTSARSHQRSSRTITGGEIVDDEVPSPQDTEHKHCQKEENGWITEIPSPV